jgi:hypothetical protein
MRARSVHNTLNNFIASSDPQITDEHVDDASSSSSSDELASQFVLTPKEKMVFHLLFSKFFKNLLFIN